MRCQCAALMALAVLAGASTVQAAKRQFYVAANQVWWDYAPTGQNQCAGGPFDDATGLYTQQGIGSRYLKALYQEYHDGTFQVWRWPGVWTTFPRLQDQLYGVDGLV